MTLSPGETINNRYRIVRVLGQGGFGAVYRAWDINFNMPCALKENLETTPEARRQFEREARLLRTLKHANLPLVTDYFIIPGKGQYLVMDFIEGQDLEHLVAAQQAPLSEDRAIAWTVQICDALEYLHSQDPPIIHRDIKPANIRITPQDKAILVDFGIAKIYDAQKKTTTGARALTPGYAPCEQYGQGRTDARSDIYALGATLYFLLTATQPLESVQRVIKDDLTAPHVLNPSVSPHVSAAILRAMHIDPEQRFQNIQEFKQALLQGALPPTVVAPAVAPTVVAHGVAPPASLKQKAIGIPKWAFIAAASLFILCFIGTGLTFGMIRMFQEKSTPQGETGEMGETLVSTPYTEGTIGASEEPIWTPSQFIEFPEDIPAFAGAKNLTSYHSAESSGYDMVSYSFEVEATIEEAVAFYEREMPKKGWAKQSSYASGEALGLIFQKDGRAATINVSIISGRVWIIITVMQPRP